MGVKFLKGKRLIIIYSIIISGFVLSGIYYIHHINFFNDFKIEIYQKNQNISNHFEVIGITFFNRESKLNFNNISWKNSEEWYFKEIKIIPIKSLAQNDSITVRYSDEINTTPCGNYYAFHGPIILRTNQDIKFSNQIQYFIKTILKSNTDEINPLILLLFLCFLIYHVVKRKRDISKTILLSENQVFIFSIIIFSLFFSIIIYLSKYLFPCGEDMVITKDILYNENPIYYYYTKLDARYFTNFLYQFLNPLYYNLPFWTFKLIPSILILSLVISVYYFNSTFCKRLKINISYSLLLVVIFFLFVPNISISLFFMGASYHYTVFIILFLNTLTLLIKYINQKTLLNAVILSILLILFLGSNEFSLLISFLIIIGIIVSEFKKDKKIKFSTLIIAFTCLTFALVVILAQGNYNRMESESGSWFSALPIGSKALHLSHRLFIDNMLFLKTLLIEKSFILILAFFWLGISLNSKLKFLKLEISNKKLITAYLLAIFFILFVLPTPFYLSGVWTKDLNGFHPQYYHNIQFFLLLFVHFIFLKLISENFQNHALAKKIASFVFKKKMFIFLITSLLLSKSLLTDTTIDVINNSLSQHYEEIKNTELYLTTKNNLSVINLLETKNKTLTVGGHDYYIRNSIIGEAYIEDYNFKTINGINSMGDTTYRNEHFKKNLEYNFNKKSKFIKKGLSLLNFKKEKQIEIIKNITLYNPELHIIESYFIGINYAMFDTSYANLQYTFNDNHGFQIAAFDVPLKENEPLFYKRYTYHPKIENIYDRYLIYLCYKGKLIQNCKIHMTSNTNSL